MQSLSLGPVKLLDYISFTVQDFNTPESVMEFLGLEFCELGYGGRRYRQRARAKGAPIDVYWDGIEEGMGVHAVLSGQALRALETLPGFPGWREWLQSVIQLGARFSRVDLAIDDMSGSIKFESVKEAILGLHLTTASNLKNVEFREKPLDPAGGGTCYVGSRQSERMMRCYMKLEARGDHFNGLRFEFEYKGAQADLMAHTIAEHGFEKAAGLIRSFIEFKDPADQDANRSRRKAADWWESLVQAAKHKVAVVRHVEHSIHKRYTHMVKQYSQTIYLLSEASGGAVDWLQDMIHQGRQKLNRTNQALLEQARCLSFSNDFAQASLLPS